LKRNLKINGEKTHSGVYLFRLGIRDVAERKNRGCKRNFFNTVGCIEKFFGREGDIYKIFKSWGAVQNLIFPSDDLFFK
jgi:hypothetical protein